MDKRSTGINFEEAVLARIGSLGILPERSGGPATRHRKPPKVTIMSLIDILALNTPIEQVWDELF